MRYDVLIITEEIQLFEDFKKYATTSLKDININLSFESDNFLNLIEYVDLLIIDTSTNDNFEYLNKNTEKIFLIDKTFCLEENSLIEDFLFKPLNFDNLISKIRHYIDNIEITASLNKKEFYNSIINNIKNPIFIINEEEKVIFSNKHFLKLLNCNSKEEINFKYKKLSSILEDEKDCITDLKDKDLENPENKNLKICININELKKYFSLQKIVSSYNKNSTIILHDISYEIEHKNELFNHLFIDNLTKLPNRAKLIDELQSNNLNLEAICLININSFKEVNDFYGHKVGDTILIDVAKLINENIAKYEKNIKLYKFPADNYCLTNTVDSNEDFIEFIKNTIDLIYKNVFIYETYEIDIRITAGISFSNKNNKLITADIALQSAKKNHKDFLVFYDELDKFREYENNMLWTKKLKSAFNNDRIEVYFQPIVNNKTLKVDKYECLVRLREDNGKIISPFFFLDISKKSNQYTKLTKIILEKSFKKFESLPFEFSVNISYEDIENPDFLDFIKQLLKKYDVKNRVVFEILEDANIKNYNLLISFIDEVKNLGCKVAIDDFGSGYSNFEYLLRMKIDYLKIDASIIKNIVNDENSFKITKTIIEFAKNLNLKTIAEYVENEEIFNKIRGLGTDYSQGYYFSEPLESPGIFNFNKT